MKLLIRDSSRFVLSLLAKAVFYSRFAGWNGSRILLYHSVEEKDKKNFEQQLQYVCDNFKIISLSELVHILMSGEVGGDKRYIAVTFDDGHKNNIHNAFPILRKLNIPATFFITSKYIDLSGKNEVVGFFNRAYPGAKNIPASMSWADLSMLLKGGMEIGSHTVSHRNMANLSVEDIRFELRESKSRIEEVLGCVVDHVSFPFGRRDNIDEKYLKLVKEHQYISNASGVRGINKDAKDLSFLYRDNIDPSWPVFVVEAILSGIFDEKRKKK